MNFDETERLDQIYNLQDSYTILYGIVGKEILDKLGKKGERSLREGTRRYGRDRGLARRNKHLNANIKINMKNLFTIGSDLPADPRFKGERIRLTPEERISRTLICPMADVWENYEMKPIGRIYCEEFHPACYSAYGFDYTTVNLSKTLTQYDDEYCAFTIVLRADNLPEELRSECFEEFDPSYSGPIYSISRTEAKQGFSSLCIRVLYYIHEVLIEDHGELIASTVMASALNKIAFDASSRLETHAEAFKKIIDIDLVEQNYPISTNILNDQVMLSYDRYNLSQLLLNNLVNPLLNNLQLLN